MGSGEAPSSRAAEEVAVETPFYPATRKRKRRVMPDDFPKRPLSAYNFFVKETRQKILANREKNLESRDVNMVKHISSLWRNIDPKERARIERLAEEDVLRYKDEVRVYEEKKDMQDKIRPAKNIKAGIPEEQATAATDRAGSVSPETVQQEKDSSSSNESLVDQLERLLAEESKALQVARSSKFHQMKLLQQAQASDPQLASFLDASRQALGLSSLLQVSKANETSETMDRRRGGAMPPADTRRYGVMPSTVSRSPNRPSTGPAEGQSEPFFPTAVERKLDGLRREEARLRLMMSERQNRDLSRYPPFEVPCNDPILHEDPHWDNGKLQRPFPRTGFALRPANNNNYPWIADSTQRASFQRPLW